MSENESSLTNNSTNQAFQILRIGYAVLPIIAGADKFLHFLGVNWTKYLAPIFPQTLGVEATTFMLIVGAIEIVAGIIVFIKPQIGAYVVAVWFLGIIFNLILIGDYYDIALRDFGLFLGALALARLSTEYAR